MTKSSKAEVHRSNRRDKEPAPDAVIRLSDAAALRAFTELSDNATVFLNGMLKVTTRTGKSDACLAEAWAVTKLPRSIAVDAVRELQDCGLLRRSEGGVVILHRVFSSLAHSFFRIAETELASAYASEVVAFGGTTGG